MMANEEAQARQEIIERVGQKHKRREWLVLNVSNKLGVKEDFVDGILHQLATEGVVKFEQLNGVEMVSIGNKIKDSGSFGHG
jgi:Mn-dependent DtxR family transcriptional regulator